MTEGSTADLQRTDDESLDVDRGENNDIVVQEELSTAIPLTSPRDGVPHVITSPAQLRAAIDALASGHGRIAVDAERASGYRYSQRAYLIQLRREGSGLFLIDPVALPDLRALQQVAGDVEWVLHAASQDLACLAEVGLVPPSLFDTELAGRLLGMPRVGLGALVESQLGLALAKEHSAADWSTRPLPESWLNYAALDVEVLLELADIMESQLIAAEKLQWAQEEFEAVRLAPPPPPRVDPWRRTSGMHKIKGRRGLAVVRELWTERDRVARASDIGPGRVLPDSAVCAAALNPPSSVEALLKVPGFTGRGQKRRAVTWYSAIARAMALSEDQLPIAAPKSDGPPNPKVWAEKNPVAWARLNRMKHVVSQVAEQVNMPSENLISPDIIRSLAWDGDADVAGYLAATRARSWQRALLAGPLSDVVD